MRRYGGASTPKPAIELTMNINFTLLAQALAFAGLIWIIATKIWPPLMNAIEERQQKIAEGLAAADRSQKDLAQAQEKVNEALKEARTKANEIIDQAHARANQIVDAARNEAITEATRQKELAQAEIDAAANRAREDLRKQVSALAVTGAEKLLKRAGLGDLRMSQALTLARPYARAAFATARDEGAFAPWSDALAFSAHVAADPRVAALLANPELGRDDAVALLAPVSHGETYSRFLAILAESHRLPLLPEISGMFDALRAEAEHVVKATVTSASELSAGELDAIKVALRKRFNREVDVTTAVDASLIGGAVIDAGDVVIDGSLKGKLARLQTALAN